MNKGCESGQTRQGCRIQQGQCLCGVGCYSEYRYSNKDECRKALKGEKMLDPVYSTSNIVRVITSQLIAIVAHNFYFQIFYVIL